MKSTAIRTTLILIIGLLVGSMVAHAQSAPLPPLVQRSEGSVFITWDANPETDITGYILHWGTNTSLVEMVFSLEDGSMITNTVNTGEGYFKKLNTGTNASAKVIGLEVGVRYFFSVKTIRADGVESDFDEEISQVIITPPNPPTNPRIVKVPVYIIDVFFADVPGEWSTNRQIKLVVDADKPYQFFTARSRMETTDAMIID